MLAMPIRLKTTLIILLGLFLTALIGPLLLPIPELKNTVPASDLAEADSRFVNIDGLSIHYKQKGSGEPKLLLLHGFGSSIFSWREVLAPLGEIGTAIAFDRPGFGFSARPLRGEWRGTNPYSPQGQLELTLTFLDELKLDKVILIGNSAGGTLATQFALTYPKRVEALILVDAAIVERVSSAGWVRPLLNTPQMNRLGPLIMRQFADEPGLEFLKSAWSNPELISDDIIAGYRKPLQADNWDKALWELSKASRPARLETRLAELAVPTLVISGADDQIVPPEQSELVAQAIPGAVFAKLDNCAHLPQEECPGEFLATVYSFINEIAVR